MAELDIPGVALNQEYRVKLGKSFTFPKENAFHTIKCKTKYKHATVYTLFDAHHAYPRHTWKTVFLVT